MKNQEEIIFELEDDALADAVKAENLPPFGGADGGSKERSTNGLARRILLSG